VAGKLKKIARSTSKILMKNYEFRTSLNFGAFFIGYFGVDKDRISKK
jgi:hypothetical protein